MVFEPFRVLWEPSGYRSLSVLLLQYTVALKMSSHENIRSLVQIRDVPHSCAREQLACSHETSWNFFTQITKSTRILDLSRYLAQSFCLKNWIKLSSPWMYNPGLEVGLSGRLVLRKMNLPLLLFLLLGPATSLADIVIGEFLRLFAAGRQSPSGLYRSGLR